MATTLTHVKTAEVRQTRLGDWRKIFLWVAVIFVLFIAVYPFFWSVITSFKQQKDALIPSLIPWVQFEPTLFNWQQEFGVGGAETFKALKNSSLIAIGATIVATTLGTTVGYGLARFRYGVGNRNLVSWFLSQRFLPPIVTVIPFKIFYGRVGLIDSIPGMILVNATFVLPFAVLIMRDFFAEFPKELEEAALVDGANHRQVFLRVALPVAGPSLVAATLICFAFAWNEFLFASQLTTLNAKPYTLLVSGLDSVRGIMFNFVSTRMLITVTVPIVLSLFVQRYIVRGLTFGAVKG